MSKTSMRFAIALLIASLSTACQMQAQTREQMQAQTREQMQAQMQAQLQERMKNINLDKPVFVKDGGLLCVSQEDMHFSIADPNYRKQAIQAEHCFVAAGGHRVQIIMPPETLSEDGMRSAMFGYIEVVLPTPERAGVAHVTATGWVQIADLTNAK